MDKKLKNFVSISIALLFSLFLLLALFGYTYNFSTIKTYNLILLILIAVTIIITIFLILEVVLIFYAYSKEHVYRGLIPLVRLGLNAFYPFVIFISSAVKSSMDNIRSFYITINNILAQSQGNKYLPEDVLVLLPHCLQNSDCGYKITNDIENCRRCGRCCIGGIIETAKKTGVMISVVTGGTAARRIVLERKPRIIVSVACERDLMSGIKDVKGIPVIGIINDRPNGPCCNTTINIEGLKKKLESIIISEIVSIGGIRYATGFTLGTKQERSTIN